MDLLIFEEFCENLKIDDLDGLRALARRHVTSAQAGKDGPWFIDPASLKKYILAGAPDLRRPGDVGETGFSDGALRATGRDWAEKVRAEIERLIPATPPADGINEISIAPASGGLPQLLTAPTPVNSITSPEVARIARWADCYLIASLRGLITVILREKKLPFAKLYDPRHYGAITADALDRLRRGSIGVSKYYPADKPFLQPRRIDYILAHADIIAGRGDAIIGLAL